MRALLVKTSSVLLCAATRWEAMPLASRLGLAPAGAGRFEKAASRRRIALLRTGMGAAAAQAALEAIPAHERFDVVLSVGFAGALQPEMARGDLVMDVQGADADLPPLAREIARRRGLRLHFGRFAHSDAVLARPQDKIALGRKERAGAVDMETAAVKRWAESRGASALAARVILDSAYDRLPEGLPGGEDAGALASYALRRPWDWPLLVSLGLRQKRGIAALGGFLSDFLEIL